MAQLKSVNQILLARLQGYFWTPAVTFKNSSRGFNILDDRQFSLWFPIEFSLE